jgi:uncharacterized protein YjbI with pentapeptide repeats
MGCWAGIPRAIFFRDSIFKSPVDATTRHRRLPFSNTLVLTGFNILEGLGVEDPDKSKWRDFVFLARGRDLRGAVLDFATLPRVDLTGANLQGASLKNGQFDRVSLDDAQLQGASVEGAQLQGASLVHAQLQGASFREARLQGAQLNGAQLQGASLVASQLQAASFDYAVLEAADLYGAQLQGASLKYAELRGASFGSTQLQGASLAGASLQVTDLSGAFFWRIDPVLPDDLSTIQFSADEATWRPVWQRMGQRLPWDKGYEALQATIMALPPGDLRDQALKRLQRLDCSDKTLASCDPLAAPSLETAMSRATLGGTSVDYETYAETLTKILKNLACSRDQDTVHIVLGAGFQHRLLFAAHADAAGIDLIDDLMNKDSGDCRVSAALTEMDRSNLLHIKRVARNELMWRGAPSR